VACTGYHYEPEKPKGLGNVWNSDDQGWPFSGDGLIRVGKFDAHHLPQ